MKVVPTQLQAENMKEKRQPPSRKAKRHQGVRLLNLAKKAEEHHNWVQPRKDGRIKEVPIKPPPHTHTHTNTQHQPQGKNEQDPSDGLGRWTWVRYKGRNNCTSRVFTVYRLEMTEGRVLIMYGQLRT